MEYDRLAAQPVTRKSGNEQFRSSDLEMQHQLLGFWQWSASDLLGNAMRGVLAEYLVALALGVADTPRVEWDTYDLQTTYSAKIEVKSSARFQTWKQITSSPIAFDIEQKNSDNSGGKPRGDKRRQADVYVFCVLDHPEAPPDPLNLDHWDFYVLSASTLNEKKPSQKSIRLTVLLTLDPTKARFDQLACIIAELSGSAA